MLLGAALYGYFLMLVVMKLSEKFVTEISLRWLFLLWVILTAVIFGATKILMLS